MSRTPPARLLRCPLRALQVFVLMAACSLAGRAQSATPVGGPRESAGAANAAADQAAGNGAAAAPPPPEAVPASPASPASPPTNEALLAAQGEPGKSDPAGPRPIDVCTPFTVRPRPVEQLFPHP